VATLRNQICYVANRTLINGVPIRKCGLAWYRMQTVPRALSLQILLRAAFSLVLCEDVTIRLFPIRTPRWKPHALRLRRDVTTKEGLDSTLRSSWRGSNTADTVRYRTEIVQQRTSGHLGS